MRQVPLSSGQSVYRDNLEYSEAAALAHPETGDLAGPFTAHLLAEDALSLKVRVNRRALNQLSAKIRVCDFTGEERLKDLQTEVLYQGNQSRTTPLYQLCFPKPLSFLTRLSLESQADGVRALCDRLRDSSDAVAVRPKREALESWLEEAAGLIRQRQTLTAEQALLRLALKRWRQDANALRLGLHGQLSTLAAKTGRDQDFAERFFPELTGHKEPDDLPA